MEPTIFEPPLKFKPRLKFFKFGLGLPDGVGQFEQYWRQSKSNCDEEESRLYSIKDKEKFLIVIHCEVYIRLIKKISFE